MEENRENIRKDLSKAEKDAQFEKEFMPLIDSLYNFAYRLTLDEDDAMILYKRPI